MVIANLWACKYILCVVVFVTIIKMWVVNNVTDCADWSNTKRAHELTAVD